MNMQSIKNWLTGMIGPCGPVHQVTVYSRTGCTCCDKAMLELRKAGRRFKLNIQVVDIDTDEALVAEYGLQIPIIAIDGKVRFKGQVNPVLLERLLKKQN